MEYIMKEKTREYIAAKIKVNRLMKKLTLRELGNMVGVSGQTIFNLENNIFFKEELAEKVINALKMWGEVL